jgi:hypothetical protein
LARRGIAGAKAYSTDCHKAANKLQQWSKFDFCIAFDLAAAMVDAGVSRQLGTDRNAYFQFMEDNASDHYPTGSATTYSLNQRVNAISKGVGPAAVEAIRTRIAKREAAEERMDEPTKDVESQAAPQ